VLPTLANFSAGVIASSLLDELEDALVSELETDPEDEADAVEAPEADDDALSLALSLDIVEAVSQAARRKAVEKITIRRCNIFMPSIC
jgi:hypothetical protein